MPVVTREIVLCRSELWLATPAPPPGPLPGTPGGDHAPRNAWPDHPSAALVTAAVTSAW